MQLMDASPRLVVRELTIAGWFEVIEGFARWFDYDGVYFNMKIGDEPQASELDEIEALGVTVERHGCRYDPED